MHMDNRESKQRPAWIVYAWIIILVLAALTLVISLPIMRRAFEESKMGPLIKAHLATSEQTQDVQASVLFPVPASGLDQYTFRSFSIPVSNRSRHALLEALLAGPPYEALAAGAVTFIPSGTRLIGVTVSYEVAYVDVSRTFLDLTPWESEGHTLKVSQLTRTLTASPGIRDVIILVEGTRLSDLVGGDR